MTQTADCLLIVTAEVDPAIEAEWNKWYDKVHLKDALACPGVLSGRRFVSAADTVEAEKGVRSSHGRRIYTAIYELAGPEAVNTKEFLTMRGWHQFSPHVRSRSMVVKAR